MAVFYIRENKKSHKLNLIFFLKCKNLGWRIRKPNNKQNRLNVVLCLDFCKLFFCYFFFINLQEIDVMLLSSGGGGGGGGELDFCKLVNKCRVPGL